MSSLCPLLSHLVIAALVSLTWCDVRVQSNGMWIDRFGGEQGLNGNVNAVTVTDSGEVYVGGFFTEAGGKVVNHIAKWTGTTWEGLGSGVEDFVNDVEITPSGARYVGGDFVEAGGQEARFIARWTGEQWERLEGLHATVFALAANDSSLFAGGRFTSTSEGPAFRLARWDGASWLDVGGGVRGPFGLEDKAIVYALALSKEGLYVGGHFLEAGGLPARNIARWDGSIWHTLGDGAGGTDGPLWSIAVSDTGGVYVGGFFAEAGGQTANNVARWTGTTWEPLGEGVNGPVSALAFGKAGDLYVGGYFTEAGGVPADNIARWTGSRWEPLGSGVNDEVWAIAVHEQDVYVGGYFTQAGGMSAHHIALWHDSNPTGVEVRFPDDMDFIRFEVVYPNPIVDEATIVFQVRQPAHVRLEIYNLLGQRATVLLDSIRPAGAHKISWRTAGFPAGSYIVRLQAGPSIRTRSVMVTR